LVQFSSPSFAQIADADMVISQVMEEIKIEHPYQPDLSFLYGVIFTGKALDSGNHSRNVTVFEDGEICIVAT